MNHILQNKRTDLDHSFYASLPGPLLVYFGLLFLDATAPVVLLHLHFLGLVLLLVNAQILQQLLCLLGQLVLLPPVLLLILLLVLLAIDALQKLVVALLDRFIVLS